MKFRNFLPIFFILVSYLSQAQTNIGIYPLAVAAGIDTYAATVTPIFSTYTSGQRFNIKFTNANTGAATININLKGAVAIRKNGATALSSGDISANQILFLQYDGTNMQVVGGGGSSGGISGLSEFLNLAIPTIYSLTSNRILPHSKRGKKLYFSKCELRKWALSGKRNSVQEIKELAKLKTT